MARNAKYQQPERGDRGVKNVSHERVPTARHHKSYAG